MFAFLRSKIARRPAPAATDGDLFDESFQQKLETLAIVSRRVFSGRNRAERRSRKRGSGVEFADHRDYAVGDDFRFVDWAAYQRFGRLLVRLYEEEEDLGIYFIVDCSASMSFNDGAKFVQARRLCAALSYVALANLDRVTIIGAGANVMQRLPTTRGKRQIFKVLDFLRGLESTGQTDLGEATKTFTAQHKRRGLAVVISDFYDPKGFERGINVLRYNRFEPYVLHIRDAREGLQVTRGDIRVRDCETGEERDITLTEEMASRLRLSLSSYNDSIERFCTTNQVPYFAADCATPFDEIVLSVFRRGGFLR